MSELDTLASRHCRPLSGAQHRLDDSAISAALAVLPAGWERIDGGTALQKTFRFADYYRTMAFVNALAFVAHRENHHPDLGVHYDRCVIRFSTHDCGGITDNDLVSAAKAERLFAEAEG
jgi:4a-hydroxytetrahydrobiopterin dehydratase